MLEKFGNLISGVGLLAAAGGYLGTLYVFFSSDRTLLALIALFVPPADVVLGFVAHPILGAIGVGGMVLAYGGFILSSAGE